MYLFQVKSLPRIKAVSAAKHIRVHLVLSTHHTDEELTLGVLQTVL